MVLKMMINLICGSLELRPDMNLYRDSDFDSFKTTFSNSPCFSNWCLRQSYPDPYPAENRSKKRLFYNRS